MMLWVLLAALVAATLAPLVWSTGRRDMRGRQEAAMSLHRAQLAELDRDLAEGRIGAPEHATALLEVQRRLLAASQTADDVPGTSARIPLLLAVVLVPLAAVALYLPGAVPDMPSEPFAQRQAEQAIERQQEDAMIAQLRARIAALDPKSDMARQGNVLLGNVEWQRGDFVEAAAAWQRALDTKFDAELAAQTAEALTRVAGHLTPGAATLFREALAQAPEDAPWRGFAQQRLQEQTQ